MIPAQGKWIDYAAVKQAVSMEAILRHYQVPGLRRQHGQLQGRCPIHRGQSDDSFRASLSKSAFQCFACLAQGNVMDFVAAMEKCSLHEAAIKLQQWFGGVISVSSVATGKELVREKEGCKLNPQLPFTLTGVDHDHSYLVHRGIDHATAVEFGIGFYSRPGLMNGRLVIPIQNVHGELVAYAGRAVDERKPKYRLPGGFHKSMELYNLHRAIATGSNTLIVVEGYFDCLRVHQAGLPWVVALMGSSLSKQQETVLIERFEQVVLMLDGDVAGREATRAIRTKLCQKCSVVGVVLDDGAQPDQLPYSEIRELYFLAAHHLGRQRRSSTSGREGRSQIMGG